MLNEVRNRERDNKGYGYDDHLEQVPQIRDRARNI